MAHYVKRAGGHPHGTRRRTALMLTRLEIDDVSFEDGSATITELGAGESATVLCFLRAIVGLSIHTADIEIIALFKLPGLPWGTERHFGFAGLQASSGQLRFSPRPNRPGRAPN